MQCWFHSCLRVWPASPHSTNRMGSIQPRKDSG